MASTYNDELTVFSNNIHLTAKAFYYYLYLSKIDKIDVMIHLAMQNNAAFWNLFRHTSLITIFIYLGKIFDKPTKSHKLDDLMKSLEKECFLDDKEIKNLNAKVTNIKSRWEKIQPVRHAVIAHDERKRHQGAQSVPSKIQNETIKYIVDELLLICDFLVNKSLASDEFDSTGKPDAIANRAKKEVEKLLDLYSAND